MKRGIGEATGGVASVQVARANSGSNGGAAEQVTSHTGDILFTFVMEGEVTLNGEEQGAHRLEAGDAYVIPPHTKTSLTDRSDDLELLEVALPARFDTIVH